jgi:putative oxidoreductase
MPAAWRYPPHERGARHEDATAVSRAGTIDGALLESLRLRALAVLRMVTAYLLLAHGTAKLFGVPHQSMFDGLQQLLFTRPVAFVLRGFMAVAYFMGHASQGHALIPLLNQGELAVLYCFVFLYLVFSGAGAWSVDAVRRSRGVAVAQP